MAIRMAEATKILPMLAGTRPDTETTKSVMTTSQRALSTKVPQQRGG
jgi:hypothetical protein